MSSVKEVFRVPSQTQLSEFEASPKWLASELFEVPGCGPRLIKISENFLVLCDETSGIEGLLQLNFDVKFETISIAPNSTNQYAGLRLYTIPSGSYIELLHSNHEVVNLWKQFLLQRINRLGFKNFFKKTMKIGKGSFASVHLALGLESNFRVAIKSYNMVEAPKTRTQSVMNEITILRSLNQNNLNKLYGVYEEDGQWHIIIELFDGGQLAYKFQSKYRFNSTEIKTIMKSLLLGLEHLHSRNIYHRDLKPQNIMFRSKHTSEVVIVDFGLSTFVTSKNYIFYRCGTPGFMAPELLKAKNTKKKADPIGDIFSLGLIFHILLVGQPLFTANSYDQLLQQNKLCQFDLDCVNYSIFTRATVDLLKKMLDTNPYTRISAEEALGHPFFNEKEVKRANRSVQAITPLLTFECYSEESIHQMNGQITEGKRYRSREKSMDFKFQRHSHKQS